MRLLRSLWNCARSFHNDNISYFYWEDESGQQKVREEKGYLRENMKDFVMGNTLIWLYSYIE